MRDVSSRAGAFGVNFSASRPGALTGYEVTSCDKACFDMIAYEDFVMACLSANVVMMQNRVE